MMLHTPLRGSIPRRNVLAFALLAGLGITGTAVGQSNITGSIFGSAPKAGDTVTITNTGTGFTRSATVDASGRYRFSSLPTGTYKVTLTEDGKQLSARDNVNVQIAGGTEVSFGTPDNVQNLGSISVVASALPAIDVSSVDTRTVLDSEKLNKLPIARNITAAALLAPGVVGNSSYDGVPSFGGSASSENAYFINGYEVTDVLTSIGSSTLPFDAIDQEQVLTGGYGAEFGRSTGGVINIVTKRGTNKWKAGLYTIWSPEALRANPRNIYYPVTGAFGSDFPDPDRRTDGTLHYYNNQNQFWESTVGGYISGPLIKDRLFLYANVETTRREGSSVSSTPQSSSTAASRGYTSYQRRIPRWTAKLDWNINDNNVIELTGVSDKTHYQSSSYTFDYADFSHGDSKNSGTETKDGGELYIGKYTGYLTDNITLTALYGKQKIIHKTSPYGYDPTCPYVSSSASSEAPGLDYNSCQTYGFLVPVEGANDKTHGGRLDLEWQLGDHDIRVGYDTKTVQSYNGDSYPGGRDAYFYVHTDDPTLPVDAGHGIVGAPADNGGLGAQGYYVDVYHQVRSYNLKITQKAEYIEDRWQVNDRLLLSLGLRNEQFDNYNGSGVIYASQSNQLAPRLGVSWDVFGDSSFKVFANAGRYFLAIPESVAKRGVLGGSEQSDEYFTYTGVDPRTGAPTGLKRIAVDLSNQYVCPGSEGAVSSNLECGEAGDSRTAVDKDLKSHYQDEYIVGMEKKLSEDWTAGARLTYRTLKSAIDDTCAPELGGACILFNPGQGVDFYAEQPDGSLKEIKVSHEELGFPDLKRDYYALDLFLEHQFSDKWYGRLDYTFSRSYGNTEGQLNSDLDTGNGGQSDVSVTEDWDLVQLMQFANGPLPNDRTHQIKAFGYYQWTPEWRFGGNLNVASGRPKSCTSFYPTADAGLYNSSVYHYCGLPGAAGYRVSPRGSTGRTPWTYQLNLNVAYTPNWLNNDLTLQLDVVNVLNSQKATYWYPRYASDRGTRNPRYGEDMNPQPPRYFRLTARYDFDL